MKDKSISLLLTLLFAFCSATAYSIPQDTVFYNPEKYNNDKTKEAGQKSGLFHSIT